MPPSFPGFVTQDRYLGTGDIDVRLAGGVAPRNQPVGSRADQALVELAKVANEALIGASTEVIFEFRLVVEERFDAAASEGSPEGRLYVIGGDLSGHQCGYEVTPVGFGSGPSKVAKVGPVVEAVRLGRQIEADLIEGG